MPRIRIQILASLNPNVFSIHVKFQRSCQTISRLGFGLCQQKFTMLETRHDSLIDWCVSLSSISSSWPSFLSVVFELASHCFLSICYDLRVFISVSEIWEASTPIFERAIAQTGWCGGHHLKFLLLRFLQRGNALSKESLKPNIAAKYCNFFLPLRISIPQWWYSSYPIQLFGLNLWIHSHFLFLVIIGCVKVMEGYGVL